MAKRNYVIDTSVFLSDPNSLYKFQNNDIFIPLKVLEEIDKHKKRQDSVGFNARKIIKLLDEYRNKGCLVKGVRIAKGQGLVKVVKSGDGLPPELNPRIADHVILSGALAVQKKFNNRRTIVVSRDINMRVIANSIGLASEDFEPQSIVEDSEKLYSGFAELVVDDQLIEQFYNDEEIVIPRDLASSQKIKLFPHQFVMLISSLSQKKTALGKFISHSKPLERTTKWGSQLDFGVVPRNKEQSFAYELLFDTDIPLVSLIGKAGSGKTLMAISAGFEQVLGLKDPQYRKLVVSRPVQPLGRT